MKNKYFKHIVLTIFLGACIFYSLPTTNALAHGECHVNHGWEYKCAYVIEEGEIVDLYCDTSNPPTTSLGCRVFGTPE